LRARGGCSNLGAMKLALPPARRAVFAVLAALALSAAACSGSSSPPAAPMYQLCPQHRVEGPECPSATAPDGVLRKDGHICADCSGFDMTGQPTAKPVDCITVAGGDLCVASCSECS
jgi:hypothetical protein